MSDTVEIQYLADLVSDWHSLPTLDEPPGGARRSDRCMKPDWSKSPEWANYLAMDEYGIWCWFEAKPFARVDGWFQGGINVRTQRLEPYHPDWESTLEQRPH